MNAEKRASKGKLEKEWKMAITNYEQKLILTRKKAVDCRRIKNRLRFGEINLNDAFLHLEEEYGLAIEDAKGGRE